MPFAPYTDPAAVDLCTGPDKRAALDAAIEASRFLEHLEAVRARSGKQRDRFRITLKPNIMTAAERQTDSPVYTDPELVEHLFVRLREEGYRDLIVVETRNVYDYSYEGRDVRSVAEMVGYSEDGYRIVDLSAESAGSEHDYGGVLGCHPVGPTWRDADYRLSFAKNKTHWQCFYTACMKNIYGCLPAWDKMKKYHGRKREFFECCVLMLEAFPVSFGFLDAWVSGDGFSGHVRDASPNRTRTIFASPSVYALDWVAGEKMRVDPRRNYVIQEALERWGEPQITTRRGDLTPWPDWVNIRDYVVWSLNAVEELYHVSRFFSRSFANQMDPRFPSRSSHKYFFQFVQRLTRLFERLMEKRKPVG